MVPSAFEAQVQRAELKKILILVEQITLKSSIFLNLGEVIDSLASIVRPILPARFSTLLPRYPIRNVIFSTLVRFVGVNKEGLFIVLPLPRNFFRPSYRLQLFIIHFRDSALLFYVSFGFFPYIHDSKIEKQK